jgi:hypothetical protein
MSDVINKMGGGADVAADSNGLSQIRLVRPVIMLLLVALAAHWPLLFSDSTLWDDTMIANAVTSHDFGSLDSYFRMLGSPYGAGLHAVIGGLPGYVSVYKLLAFASLCVAMIGIFLLALQFGFALAEAFLIAAVASIYPFFSSWRQLIDLPYALGYAAFFTGMVVYFRDLRPPKPASLRMLLAVGLFAIALALLSSNLVYIYGMFACVFLASGHAPWIRSSLTFAKENLLFLILPPVEFFAIRLAFPRTGRAVHYNEIQPDSGQVAKMMLVAPKRIVIDQLADLWSFVRHDTAFFALLLVYAALAFAGIAIGIRRFPTRRPTGKQLLGILVGAAVLFAAGVFPYAIVGKFMQINSYNDRHAILAMLPVAIGIVMVLRFALRSDRAFRIAGLILLVLCCVLQVRNYVLWQNRYVKYLAIAENLKGQEDRLQSIIVFDDQAELGERELLRGYEANWILKQAFQDERHIGFDAKLINKAAFDHARNDLERNVYMFQDAQFGPNSTRIDVLRETPLTEPMIYCKYYLSGADERNAFLKSLVKLKFTDTPTDSWLVK